MLDLLVRIEMEPVLAALLLGSAVPCDRQRLNASIGEFDQILLQRKDAECVFHLESGKLAVGTVGLDQEFAVLTEEAGVHAVIVEAGIVEIAKNRVLGRMVHCLLVMRAMPQLSLCPMASGAGLAADERRDGRVACVPGGAAAIEEIKTYAGGDDEHCRE